MAQRSLTDHLEINWFNLENLSRQCYQRPNDTQSNDEPGNLTLGYSVTLGDKLWHTGGCYSNGATCVTGIVL